MESLSVLKGSAEASAGVSSFSYRLDLAYIGSSFHGWQSQLDGQGVQDAIERALRTIVRPNLRIIGASRTDTGVHAEHQVAIFRAFEKIDCFRVFRSLQALLPPSIGLIDLQPIEQDFHPIKHACSKVYRYRLWLSTGQNPFVKPYVWHVHAPLDFKRMQTAADELIGRHNFKSFCATDSSAKTFDRTILDLHWVQRGPLLEFYIMGEGFLKQMVRSLVGTLVEIGSGRREPNDIVRLLQVGDRRQAGKTAPAQGLSLLRIFYEPTYRIPASLISSGAEFGFSLSGSLPGNLD
ncbi:MAG: tRNA pseudouridine(38-40) synthase TruA [Proteobacteria bacterium]|nr:tRNA pseudouridine(38-40) synthase TruA [Pseudomonadota bacterium]